ncbi:MAG: enoyl-CoA hydratase-related protein [Pseudomonadales bacterium]|jgi:E-phenylitaconyl-CoA hydratase|nr:enoyl-CoA hydratase-related protein [Pseudomonadales bacterium]MDP7597824.1 enoyl-CoA hydratase-related protein [Pseudomonadales bacterium]HJN53292.1 enoyl-CoA hydratase-related protein [Pseudomonadales bacterium]|tara:strand:- start:9942 stop:10718 length:777 start_codon:yes stop_codon:yes gene_type:complete
MDSVIYEIKDKIAYVTINRPQALNACDEPTYDRLAEVWQDFRSNDDAWIAIITGMGERAFCAGSDIKKNFTDEPRPAGTFEHIQNGTLTRGLEIWKPIIAAINGHCNGGGLEMALACDIRVAADHAQFGLGEVKIGLLPGGGGTQRLPRAISLCNALWMLYTGDRIDAEEAHRIGLVNRVVALPELMSTAEAMAQKILEAGPVAVRAIKEAAIKGLSMSLEDGLQLEQDLFGMLRTTEDSREGTRAFAEKRKPRWQAR